MKMFRFEDMKGNDIFNALLEDDNVYICLYGSLKLGKLPRDLEVGESCVQKYSMSMTGPTDYRIIRVE